MRTLTFQFITDSRFNESRKDLENLIAKLDKNLDIAEILVEKGRIRELNWPPETEHGSASKQWRITYWIKKTRKITWNEIYALVNSIKAVCYKFL